jgi:hypothetical protein
MTMNNSTSTFTVSSTGTYEVTFRVRTVQTSVALGISVNGSVSIGNEFYSSNGIDAGQALMRFNAGDSLQLINATGSTISLPLGLDTTASMIVTRVS